jgi:hypothetical protein
MTSKSPKMQQCGAHAVTGDCKWCSYETGHPGLHSFSDPRVGERCVAVDPLQCRWDACRACIGDPA